MKSYLRLDENRKRGAAMHSSMDGLCDGASPQWTFSNDVLGAFIHSEWQKIRFVDVSILNEQGYPVTHRLVHRIVEDVVYKKRFIICITSDYTQKELGARHGANPSSLPNNSANGETTTARAVTGPWPCHCRLVVLVVIGPWPHASLGPLACDKRLFVVAQCP